MIIGYFGLPRSGKTTMLARYIKRKAWRYNHIYISGEQLLDYDDDFISFLHPYEVGTFKPIDNSLFVLCEAGTYFNNRLISKIPHYCTDFFALHGHYGCDILWDSQSVDVDKKLRDRTSRLFVVDKSLIPCFSHVVRIKHRLGVNPETKDLAETYTVPDSFLSRLTSVLTFGTQWIFRPLYYDIFDTHSDILFDSDGLLPKSVVMAQCPANSIRSLKVYFDMLEVVASEKKSQTVPSSQS